RTRASKSLALASVRSMSTSWEWSPPLIWPDSDETKTASAPFCTTVSHGEYSSEGSYPLVARNAMRRPLRSLMDLLLMIGCDCKETRTASAPFCTTVSDGEYSSEGSYPLVARNAMRRPLRSLMDLLLMIGCDFKASRLGSTSEGYVVCEMERYLQRQWPLASQ